MRRGRVYIGVILAPDCNTDTTMNLKFWDLIFSEEVGRTSREWRRRPRRTGAYLLTFCAANSLRLRILNTDFQKPLSKQATFRENTTPIGRADYYAENGLLPNKAEASHPLRRCTKPYRFVPEHGPYRFIVELKVRICLAAALPNCNFIPKCLKPNKAKGDDPVSLWQLCLHQHQTQINHGRVSTTLFL